MMSAFSRSRVVMTASLGSRSWTLPLTIWPPMSRTLHCLGNSNAPLSCSAHWKPSYASGCIGLLQVSGDESIERVLLLLRDGLFEDPDLLPIALQPQATVRGFRKSQTAGVEHGGVDGPQHPVVLKIDGCCRLHQ